MEVVWKAAIMVVKAKESVRKCAVKNVPHITKKKPAAMKRKAKKNITNITLTINNNTYINN
jgi:hypothetical protein